MDSSSADQGSQSLLGCTSAQPKGPLTWPVNPDRVAVDAEALLLVLLPVAFGIVVGFLLNPVAEWWTKLRRRKALILVLAPEVETIHVMASSSIKEHEANVKRVKASLTKPGPSMEFVAADDADYPTRVYDSHLEDIDLFGANLALEATNLYRWVSFAHYWKRRHLEYYREFIALTRAMMIGGGSMTESAENYFAVVQHGMVHYAEVYLQIQARIENMADSFGEELARLSRRARPTVDLNLDHVVRTSTR